MVATADICNQSGLAQAVNDARNRFGTITGVIHGAGVIDDGPLMTK